MKSIVEASRSARSPILTQQSLAALLPGDPDAVSTIEALVADGVVDRLAHGVWLVPTGIRPEYSIPRFWSNPNLQDPQTLCALVAMKPCNRDVVRTVIAYGVTTFDATLELLLADEQMNAAQASTTRRMLAAGLRAIVRLVAGEDVEADLAAGPPRTARLEEMSRRLKKRPGNDDLLEIWRLLAVEGHPLEAVIEFAMDQYPFGSTDFFTSRLLRRRSRSGDGQFVPRPGGPRTPEELHAWMTRIVFDYEVRDAARAIVEDGFAPEIGQHSAPGPNATN